MKNLSAGNYALAQACRHWLRDEAEHEKVVPTPNMKFGNAFHRGSEQWILSPDSTAFSWNFKALVEAEGLRAETWAPKVEARLLQWEKSAIKHSWHRLIPEQSFAFNTLTGQTRKLEGKGWRTWQDVDRAREITLTIDGLAAPVDVDDDLVEVYDWKTGRVNAEKDIAQIRICALAAAKYYKVDRAIGHVVYVSDDAVVDLSDGFELDEFDMIGDHGVLERVFALEDSEPRPGTHCKNLYCAARKWCEAKR